MFKGHAICNLDNKSRLVLPAKFRKYIQNDADNKVILTRGVPECILVYPQNIWDKVQSILMNYNYFIPDERLFIKGLLFHANDYELDSQHRILLPSDLIEFAHIKKEVVVVGMIDKLEIWDPEMMKNDDENQKSSYAEIAQKVTESIYSKLSNT